MSAVRSDARIIAVCGLDGVGKSTLLARVREARVYPEAAYVMKQDRARAELLIRHYQPCASDVMQWATGAFARGMSMASALDFLAHYERRIIPLIEANRSIVSDRYAMCYVAYMLATGWERHFATRLMCKVRHPDQILFVTAREDQLEGRYEGRGKRSPCETLVTMRRFAMAYEELLGTTATPVAMIDNSGCGEEAYAAMVREIGRVLTVTDIVGAGDRSG